MKQKITRFAGIDIGSMTTKCVLMDEMGGITDTMIIGTAADPKTAGKTVIESLLKKNSLEKSDLRCIAGTGYGRISLDFFDHTATELTCHTMGVRFLNPEILGIIDMGGQDSKAIKLGPDGGIIDFVLNDRCAAGTGRFLEVMADALQTDLECFGEMYLSSQKPCSISSTCSVFAESEVISLLAQGKSKIDISAGLHQGIAKRIGNMAKRLGIKEKITFVGGVAKNRGMKKALEDYMGVEFITLKADPQITGAMGAAVLARARFQACA